MSAHVSRHAKLREAAVRRGLRFMARLAAYEALVPYLGSGMLWFCRSLVTSGSSQLKPEARQLARSSFRCWQRHEGQLPDTADAASIAEHVRAYGAAEAMGFCDRRMKAQLRRGARAFQAGDFLGFDPRTEAPPLDIPDVCTCGLLNVRGRRRCASKTCRGPLARMHRHRVWCLALTSAYCGERYGVRLGARYQDVLNWLPAMRPYEPVGDVTDAAFSDISYTVTHVVYTLNDYGRRTLSRQWLPWEYEFLRGHLDRAMDADDPDMTGEFMDTLRAFSVTDTDPQVHRGFDFLLATQNADGSWGEWDHDTVYTGFHATWSAIDGLREFGRRRHGLTFPELLPRLTRWAAAF